MRNPLGSFGNFTQAVGEMVGMQPRDWHAEHQRFLETKTEDILAVAGVAYAITKRREGSEAATLEVKRFLHEVATRETQSGIKDIESEIAGALIDKAFESPEELERLMENSQTRTK